MLARQGPGFRDDLACREWLGFVDEVTRELPPKSGWQVERAPSSMAMRASGPKGFDISVMVENGHYILTFGEWTEEFGDATLAHRLISAAVDGTARLKVDAIAGRNWRWTLECLDEDGRWIAESTVGHVIWRFWGQPSTSYLRNIFPRRPVSGCV